MQERRKTAEMKLVTFTLADRDHLGCILGAQVLDLTEASGGSLPDDMLGFIKDGERARATAAEVVAHADMAASMRPIDEVDLRAPIPRPHKNVFAVGKNYLTHIEEGATAREEAVELPEVPVFFTKTPTTVIGPGATIPWRPDITKKLDWEAELAVIIGREGRDIREAEAFQYIFGYTAANDVSARDLQFRGTQWFKGKSLDRSCPLGPVIVTRDEILDPGALDIECRVNGEVKQKANTRDMIFGFAQIIAALSAGMTLEPGDVILTGTPEGVGFARKPPEFLKPGDCVEVEIAEIGILKNVVGQDPMREFAA